MCRKEPHEKDKSRSQHKEQSRSQDCQFHSSSQLLSHTYLCVYVQRDKILSSIVIVFFLTSPLNQTTYVIKLKNILLLNYHSSSCNKETKTIFNYFTWVTRNSTLCFPEGFTVISLTLSPNPKSPSLLIPPYCVGICSQPIYLFPQNQIKSISITTLILS